MNHETYTEECAHLQSNTEFFFYSSTSFFFVPWHQCKILVLSNDNSFVCFFFCFFFVFYKCANKTDLESFSTQCKCPGSSGAVTELSLHVSPARSSLNTAPRCFAFHFQVKCSSSKNHTASDQSRIFFVTGFSKKTKNKKKQTQKSKGRKRWECLLKWKSISHSPGCLWGGDSPAGIIQTPACRGRCTFPSAPETGSCHCPGPPASSCRRSGNSSHGPSRAPCTPGPAWPRGPSWCGGRGSCSGAGTASVASGPAGACSRCAAFAAPA